MPFKTLEITEKLRGKRVLVRVDANVPVKDGKINESFRLDAIIPTLRKLSRVGARVVVISHIEHSVLKKSFSDKATLYSVFLYLKKTLPISFFQVPLSDVKESVSVLSDGPIIFLENLRQNSGEEANSPEFARLIASLGDIYVNEAFSVSHRSHASIVGVPKLLPSFSGPRFSLEVERLRTAFNPPKPFLVIIGGAKFDTKLPIIKKFLGVADNIYVGGALANDLFRARGFDVGESLVSEPAIPLMKILDNSSVRAPTDAVVMRGESKRVENYNSLSPDAVTVDIGQDSLRGLEEMVKRARFILWNGPLGRYEEGFVEGTEALAKMIAESTAESIIGGGDTVACVSNLGLFSKFSFVSTGGGAMLEFLSNETLPGIQALEESAKKFDL